MRGSEFFVVGAAEFLQALALAVWLVLLYGLYRLAVKAGDEMEARGENGTPYSLMVFFMPLIGIPYWLMRRREIHPS